MSTLSLSNASLTGFAVRVAGVEGVSGGGSSAIVRWTGYEDILAAILHARLLETHEIERFAGEECCRRRVLQKFELLRCQERNPERINLWPRVWKLLGALSS